MFVVTSFSRFSAVGSWYCCLCLWQAGFFCVCELASRLDEALHKLPAAFPLILTPCCICAVSRKGNDSTATASFWPTDLFRESVKLRAEGDVKCGCLQQLIW